MCVIDKMDDLLTCDLKRNKALCRAKYINVLQGFGSIQNNIITTEVRINKLESMECIGASKTFIDLQSGITEQLCTFKDAGFDVTSVVQASTISELYHELWVLFKKCVVSTGNHMLVMMIKKKQNHLWTRFTK